MLPSVPGGWTTVSSATRRSSPPTMPVWCAHIAAAGIGVSSSDDLAIRWIADQLRAAVPRADWDMAGHDRAAELAGMLVREGVRDLYSLTLEPVTVHFVGVEGQSESSAGHEVITEFPGFTFVDALRGRRFGFVGTPDRQDHTPNLEISHLGHLVAWSARGGGNVSYVVAPGGEAGRFAIYPVWQSSSSWNDVHEVARAIGPWLATFVLPTIAPALAQSIGSTIMGAELAASYPAMSAAIGRVTIGTAVNGGDVAGAVRSVASQYLGAQAGGLTATATGIDTLGAVAQSAAVAALRGGDVRQAVASTLIQRGISSMAQALSFYDPGYTGDPFAPPSVLPGALGPLDTPIYYSGIGNDPLMPVPGAPLPVELFPTESYPYPWEMDPWPAPEPSLPVPVVPLPSIPPIAIPQVPGYPSSSGGERGIWSEIASGIRAVVQLLPAVRAAGGQAPVTRPTQTLPDGSRVVYTDQGTMIRTSPTGQTTVERIPAGVATMTTSGAMVVNNGNGTYDVVTADGRRQTRPYASGGGQPVTIAGMQIDPWLLLAGGAVALLLLSRRRG